ncbi:hypothetical protein EYW47_07745 [Paraburkholderia silviterrae]|nr:hypothetical protein EYW47_07745 [Paraburkholderia silviterrae]
MGAWLGGLAITHGIALAALPWVAAAVAIAALILTWAAARLDARKAPLRAAGMAVRQDAC